ncbi:MAG TPA: hypothetical protein VG345_08585 [Bryobacteraceae bacterium]|nr:hypothetical protein [Bryobacteraceae bacterium]
MSGLWLALVLASAAAAETVTFQVTGITGGFVTGCTGDGCGGKFQATAQDVGSAGNAGSGSFFVYCVDSQNTVEIPSETYQADISTITAGSDLSNTRYGRATSQWSSASDPSLPITFRANTFGLGAGDSLTPTALERYQMAAWLVDQYAVLPSADRTAVQDAVWQVMDVVPPEGEMAAGNYIAPPYPDGSTPAGAEVGTLISDAAQFVKYNSSSAFFSQFELITNTAPLYVEGQDPAQELIAITPAPEPLSFAAVIGVILAALVTLRIKFRPAGA